MSGGSVERRQVECDAGKIALTEAQAERSAGFVQRGGTELKNRIHAMTEAQLVLHGASPLVIGDGEHDVVIARFGNSHDRVVASGQIRGRGSGSTTSRPTADRWPRARLRRNLRGPTGDVSHRPRSRRRAQRPCSAACRVSAGAMNLFRSDEEAGKVRDPDDRVVCAGHRFRLFRFRPPIRCGMVVGRADNLAMATLSANGARLAIPRPSSSLSTRRPMRPRHSRAPRR